MIKSIWKIEFVTASGTYLLLDHGEDVESEPEFSAENNTAISSPIFQPFASAFPLGGVKMTLTWTRIRQVYRPRTRSLLDALYTPWTASGYMRVTIEGGAGIVFSRSAIKGVSPSYELAPYYLMQAYTAELGPPQGAEFNSGLLHTTRAVGQTGDIFTPTVISGLAPYTCAVFDGAMPPGYTLTTSGAGVGKITGTPTTAGTYWWTLALSDARGCRTLSDYSIIITP